MTMLLPNHPVSNRPAAGHGVRALLMAFALLVASVPGAALGETRLALTTEDDNPPFTFVDRETGRPTGLATDMVKVLMDRAGIEAPIQVLPWVEAFARAAGTEDTCVFATNRTPERENRFKWVGPLSASGWALFARGDDPLQLSALGDARPYTIGTHAGSALDEYLRTHDSGLKLVPAIDNTLNLRKLAVGRIDLWAAGTRTGPWLARELGFEPLSQVLVIRDSRHFLACNPHVPDELIDRLNAILAGMEGDGTMEGIRERYR